MPDANQLAEENAALRKRITALSGAILRVSTTLEVATVLKEIGHSARTLVDARYGVIITIDDTGKALDIVTSGLTAEEERQLTEWEEGAVLLERLGGQSRPLRLNDLPAYVRSLGLSDALMRSQTLQAVPMRHRGKLVGSLFLAEKEDASEFTDDDEEVLILFAAQAAAAVANARAHREEQRTRADMEALVETSPVGVVVFDANTGLPLSLNGEARRMAKPLQTPGRSLATLPSEVTMRRADGSEMAMDTFPLTVALSTAETVRAEEITLSVPDGRRVEALLNATPIRGEDGAVTSVVATLQDLAPLREMERQRAEFLGLVSHELRAPLSAIKGSAVTVLGSPTDLDPVETREFFRIIDEQADHMRTLIGDLLDTGRIEAGTLSVTPEHTQVAALVERARKTFASGGADYPLHIDLPANLPPVMADRQRIVQVLNNLFANAARHSPTGAPIRVDAIGSRTHVSISVSDDGAGVSPEQLPYLFRKESAASGGARRLGAGLGLSICKGLVEAHGGRIQADSEGLGHGMRVTFTLPAVDGAASRARATAADPNREGGRILIVDDDPQALRFARNALNEAGYATVVTSEPREVGDLVRAEGVHLVLLDLLLPDADGVELMGEVPELGDLPVIFVSAYGRDETIARAFEAGAADYIVKPFSPTELIARIRAALRQHHAPEPFRLAELAIDYDERRVTLGGERLVLTATEYELLRVLSANAGRVATYEAIQRRVWGDREHGEPALVRTFIKKLRQKLGDSPANPTYILNERGIGYRMPRPAEG